MSTHHPLSGWRGGGIRSQCETVRQRGEDQSHQSGAKGEEEQTNFSSFTFAVCPRRHSPLLSEARRTRRRRKEEEKGDTASFQGGFNLSSNSFKSFSIIRFHRRRLVTRSIDAFLNRTLKRSQLIRYKLEAAEDLQPAGLFRFMCAAKLRQLVVKQYVQRQVYQLLPRGSPALVPHEGNLGRHHNSSSSSHSVWGPAGWRREPLQSGVSSWHLYTFCFSQSHWIEYPWGCGKQTLCVCMWDKFGQKHDKVELWGCGGLREAQLNAECELHTLTPAAQQLQIPQQLLLLGSDHLTPKRVFFSSTFHFSLSCSFHLQHVLTTHLSFSPEVALNAPHLASHFHCFVCDGAAAVTGRCIFNLCINRWRRSGATADTGELRSP